MENTTEKLLAVLKRLLAAAPAFRSKNIGSPNSQARASQVEHIAAEDAARKIIAELDSLEEAS